MAEKILSSPRFEIKGVFSALENLLNEIPTNAIRKPNDLCVPGAFTFVSEGHVRLVMQYDIQTGKNFARFDVLVDLPDEA